MSQSKTVWYGLAFMAAVSILSVTSGCALGDRKIALTYAPATTAKSDQATKVVIEKFQDVRSDKSEVGEVRNGYGIKMARVLLSDGQDAGAWVSNALCAELQKAGCDAQTKADAANSKSALRISGSIQELYTKMYMTYDTKVRVQVTVTRAGLPVLNKEYVGKASSLAVLGTAQEYEQSAAQALQDAMKQAVPEILSPAQ